MADVRVGTIGWNYPEWRGTVYAEDAKPDEFLAQYARRFRAVESASSYYGMPKTSVAQAWADATPEGFELSLKLPDWIVRKKPDDPELPRVLEVFLTHMAPLEAAKKLGTVVVQLHPSYRFEKKLHDLRRLVALLPQGPRWAVELRHASWWRDETYELLSDAGIALVWSYLGVDERTPPVATTDRLYLRLFGERDLEEPFDRKRRDAGAELARWVDAIRVAAPSVTKVDVMVSKYLEGYAPGTAATVSAMLGLPEVDVSAPLAKKGQTTLDGLFAQQGDDPSRGARGDPRARGLSSSSGPRAPRAPRG